MVALLCSTLLYSTHLISTHLKTPLEVNSGIGFRGMWKSRFAPLEGSGGSTSTSSAPAHGDCLARYLRVAGSSNPVGSKKHLSAPGSIYVTG
jgi:hypothetical protein